MFGIGLWAHKLIDVWLYNLQVTMEEDKTKGFFPGFFHLPLRGNKIYFKEHVLD